MNGPLRCGWLRNGPEFLPITWTGESAVLGLAVYARPVHPFPTNAPFYLGVRADVPGGYTLYRGTVPVLAAEIEATLTAAGIDALTVLTLLAHAAAGWFPAWEPYAGGQVLAIVSEGTAVCSTMGDA